MTEILNFLTLCSSHPIRSNLFSADGSRFQKGNSSQSYRHIGNDSCFRYLHNNIILAMWNRTLFCLAFRSVLYNNILPQAVLFSLTYYLEVNGDIWATKRNL